MLGILGNTKKVFGVSVYVLAYQRQMWTEKLVWECLGILEKLPLRCQNMYLLIKKMNDITNQGGNTKQMFLGYQNMHLLIKNMCKQKNRVGITGNTRKSTFKISEHVLTNQKY